MKFSQVTLLFLILIGTANISFAQKDIRKADKQLELKVYDLAIKNYKAYLDENPNNNYAQLKLAEAYRRTNELMKAVYWYEKSVSMADTNTDDILNYAACLKKLGLYEKAQKVYTEMQGAENKALAQTYIAGCDQAIELLKAEEQFEIEAFDGNSTFSDFGAVSFNNNIIFSSFRTDVKRKNGKKNLSYIQTTGNEIFTAPMKDKIDIAELKLLRSELNAVTGVGPLSIDQASKRVAFTKNNLSDGAVSVEYNDSDLSIYIADLSANGDYTNETPLPFNEVEYSYAFPHLAFNGTALYFSSNRPGGLGGFDIYVSYLKKGNWSEPQNLGAEVNSDANEITPFYFNDQLYFSSDDINGLGGFDVYQSSITDGKWSAAQNIGKGINSPGDDYYLTVEDTDQYIFTSNRLGGRGKDDIYMASKIITLADEVLAQDIPKAVNLDDLAAAKNEVLAMNTPDIKANEQMVSDVSAEEEVIKTTAANTEESMFNSEGEFKLYDHYELDLSGAIKNNEDVNTDQFFIQIAALKESKGQITDFSNLTSLGKLYRFVLDRSTKIRLGTFKDKSEAERVLAQVRSKGYRDAFITVAKLSDTNIELIPGNGFVDYYSGESNAGPQYKVRLASYSDATWFNTNELEYLDGELEQWTKGAWHIFILSGFNSIEEAEAARIKAVNRGFKEAEVVLDDRGVLKRLNKN